MYRVTLRTGDIYKVANVPINAEENTVITKSGLFEVKHIDIEGEKLVIRCEWLIDGRKEVKYIDMDITIFSRLVAGQFLILDDKQPLIEYERKQVDKEVKIDKLQEAEKLSYNLTELSKVYIVQDMGFTVDRKVVYKGSKCEVKDIKYAEEKIVMRCVDTDEDAPVGYVEVSFKQYEKLKDMGILVLFGEVVEEVEPKYALGEVVKALGEYGIVQRRKYDEVEEEWEYKLLCLEFLLSNDDELRYNYVGEKYIDKITEEIVEFEVEENESKYAFILSTNDKGIRMKTPLERAAERMSGYLLSLGVEKELAKLLNMWEHDLNNLDLNNLDKEELADRLIENFTKKCVYEKDEVCVNDKSEHCADFVCGLRCGICKLRVVD